MLPIDWHEALPVMAKIVPCRRSPAMTRDELTRKIPRSEARQGPDLEGHRRRYRQRYRGLLRPR